MMKLALRYLSGWVIANILIYLGISLFSSSETANSYIIYVAIGWAIISIFAYREEKKNPNKNKDIKKVLTREELINKRFKLNEKGYFSLWKGKIIVSFKAPETPKIEDYTVTELMVSQTGWDKLLCIDSQNNELIIDVEDIETKFTYKSKRYDDFDEVLEEAIGFDDFCEMVDEPRTDYISYIQELDSQERDEKLKIASFSPVLLNFSIFGDYFDLNQPANHMKFELLCDGILGYADSGNPYALTGINTANNERVDIRITAIRTLIKYNNEKYERDDFVELAKTFK
ncbi:hypothetical protein [Avibacterium paragallinarum]|uniref:hypothetical protein n=1 Tax=Avibacterium paragallinarum TaxID=728 RepID=UPI001267F2DF|nr:hypothetical protein [Avibacterium paragallinarum]QIR10959.1 hypothetical protein HBL79_01045 [Avibacterium paragallinarum]QLD64072.1 hypothetical protein VY92_001165 [Avibacterium paragallinarum]